MKLFLFLGVYTLAKFPTIKWSQDKQKVYLAIEAKCAVGVKSDDVVRIETDQLYFSCGGFEANITLREDVVGGFSECNPKPLTHVCVLQKKEEHFWDRLLFSLDETRKHKRELILERASAEFREEEVSNNNGGSASESIGEVYAASKSKVKKLTDQNFEQVKQQNEFLVVDITFPWCVRCEYYRSPFAKAAKILQGEATFGYVDALEQRELRHRLNARCVTDCVWHLFTPQGQTTVKAEWDPDTAAKAIRARLTPAVKIIPHPIDANRDFNEYNKTVVYGTFSSNHDTDFLIFYDTANDLRELNVAFVAAFDPEIKAPKLHAYSEGEITQYAGSLPLQKSEISRFAKINSFPLVSRYTWSVRETTDALGLPCALVWFNVTDDTSPTDEELAIFREAARAFKSRAVFFYLGQYQNYMKPDYGLDEAMVPAFAISSRWEADSPKYGLLGEINLESVKLFVEDYLAQKLKPSFRSEPVPTDAFVAGQVRKVVANQIPFMFENQDEVLLVVSRPWDKTWNILNKALTRLAHCIQEAERTYVATMDADKNYVDPAKFSKSEETQRIYFLQNGVAHEYNGKQSLKELLLYLKKESPTVAKVWDSVKKYVDAINADERAQKEVIKKAEEERKRKTEEEAKEKLEKLKTAEKIDLSGDGGVVKQTYVSGTGDIPAAGDRVEAHYIGTLEDGTQFDSSRDRGIPFGFTLGNKEVIRCWDVAFAAMRVGERAVIHCTAAYAYGAKQTGKIPPNSDLNFDVELLDFTQNFNKVKAHQEL